MWRKMLLGCRLVALCALPAAYSHAAIVWDSRYDGNVLPTAAGAIQYSDSTSGSFETLYAPNLSTDGSVLTIGPTGGNAGLVRQDSTVPYPGSSTMQLNPAIGYTAEWRAELNSPDPSTPGYAPYSLLQLSNGTNGQVKVGIGLADTDTSTSDGYDVQIVGVGGSEAAVPVTAGYHVFRATVLNDTTNLYVDGTLASTRTEAALGGATYEVRFGDFSGGNSSWTMDYLYLYAGGAVAPAVPEPASLGLVVFLSGATLARRRR